MPHVARSHVHVGPHVHAARRTCTLHFARCTLHVARYLTFPICSPHSFLVSSSHHQRPSRSCWPGCDGTGAGLAADRDEAPIVERVVGHVVIADVRPHLRRGPVAERVELEQRTLGRPERLVELDHRHVGPRSRALILALAGDPASGATACARRAARPCGCRSTPCGRPCRTRRAPSRERAPARSRAAGKTPRS